MGKGGVSEERMGGPLPAGQLGSPGLWLSFVLWRCPGASHHHPYLSRLSSSWKLGLRAGQGRRMRPSSLHTPAPFIPMFYLCRGRGGGVRPGGRCLLSPRVAVARPLSGRGRVRGHDLCVRVRFTCVRVAMGERASEREK